MWTAVDGTQSWDNASVQESVNSTIATIGLVLSRRALAVLFVLNFTLNFVSNGLQDVVIYWSEVGSSTLNRVRPTATSSPPPTVPSPWTMRV